MNFLVLLVGAVAVLSQLLPVIMAPPEKPAAIPHGYGKTEVRVRWPEWKPAAFAEFPPSEPQNKFMAAHGSTGIHADGFNSDVHRTGPTGKGNMTMVTRVGSKYPGGMCATITFSKKGNLVALCASLAGFELHLLEPKTLNLLAKYTLPQRPSTFHAVITLNPKRLMQDTSGGAYYYLDNEDNAVLADAQQEIQKVGHRQLEDGSWEFFQVTKWDMRPHVPHDCFNYNNWFPKGKCDPITAVAADYEGHIWWVTRQGIVGCVNPKTNTTVTMNVKEEMQNGITTGEDGIYIVTTFALYRFVLEKGAIKVVWRREYDRGTFQKPGMLSIGSGTAPTLIGDMVTINDNADDHMKLLVFKRSTGKKYDTAFCSEPLFSAGISASDNSMVAIGNSIFMENNYGYESAVEQGKWDMATIPGGIQRVDVDSEKLMCKTVWTNPERAPSCVAKMGAEVGLLYFYTFDEEDDGRVLWSLTAVDAFTGKTVFKVPTGYGRNYDNNWGPITLGPDGTAYIGVLQGLVAVYDS